MPYHVMYKLKGFFSFAIFVSCCATRFVWKQLRCYGPISSWTERSKNKNKAEMLNKKKHTHIGTVEKLKICHEYRGRIFHNILRNVKDWSQFAKGFRRNKVDSVPWLFCSTAYAKRLILLTPNLKYVSRAH